MADRRNKAALPTLATKHGFRLPPPEDCLIAPNFQFHPRSAPEQMDWEEDSLPSGENHTGAQHACTRQTSEAWRGEGRGGGASV